MFGLSRLRAVEIGVALLLTLAAFLIGFRVLAEERGIRVSDAWARPTAGQSTTSAAYMTIANQGEGNDMLTAARTPKAEAIELHRTTMTVEGVMQMRQIKDGLPIEAGKTIELKPGGTHFMLLGLVRINMPNKHAVYMHDTPLKALFSQSARAFSSGCVRVERVFDLVAWLLGEQGWTLAKVEDQIASGKKIDVKLKKPVPVHFVYLSAFAAGNGMAQFRPDIYGQDAGYGMDMDEQDAVVLRESRAITP